MTKVPLPRTPTARSEAFVLLALGLLFTGFLLPAVGHARREYRDGQRRQTMREVKTALEQWNNMHRGYPLHPTGALERCGISEQRDDWLFSGVLVRDLRWAAPPQDPRPRPEWVFRYCPTEAAPQATEAGRLASGFILDTRLENSPPAFQGFNAEHNMFERTALIDAKPHFQICGGTNIECGTER